MMATVLCRRSQVHNGEVFWGDDQTVSVEKECNFVCFCSICPW